MKTNLQPLHHYINKACSSFKSILLLLVFTAICFHTKAVAPAIASFSPVCDTKGTTITITGTNYAINVITKDHSGVKKVPIQ